MPKKKSVTTSKKRTTKKTTKQPIMPNVSMKKSDTFVKVNASNAYGVLLPPNCNIYLYSVHRQLPTENKKVKLTTAGLNFNEELADVELQIDAELIIPGEAIQAFKFLFDELLPKWEKMKEKVEEGYEKQNPKLVEE